MKLAKLRGAIRSAKGNPSIVVELTPGVTMTLPLQKTALLAELGRAYEDADDTGLTFDVDTGIIGYPSSPVDKADVDEDDDLL